MTRRIEEEGRFARWSRRKTQAAKTPAAKTRGAAAPVADADRTAAPPPISSVSPVPGAEGPAMPWTPPLAYADENDDRAVGLYAPDDAPGEITDDDRAKAAEMGLPDIETLGPGSDFKPFLRDGVPAVLKRLALRKLWTSNPAFAVLDGLNDYDENFRVTNVLIDAADTAYKVGKSYFSDAEKDAEVAEGAEEDVAEEDAAEEAAADDPDHTDREDERTADSQADDSDDTEADDPDHDVGDAEDDLA
jgi:hypothetical protein